MNKTYFISDLHLDPSRPHLYKLFHEFIDKIKGDAEALYILGDLFEFWIGDDIIDLPIGKPYLPIIEQLRSLSNSGTKIYFIQGNRDFLIGQKFMDRIGGVLLPDEIVIDLYGTPALIMHGDTLCTDDKGYQLMRKIFRLWIVQKIYLSMSPEKRDKKASEIRCKTSKQTKQKDYNILDVNQQAVEKALVSKGVSLLIHGHTHRPAEHEFYTKNKNKNKKRVVLGDWGDKWSYLQCGSGKQCKLYF
ncbi:UDP-2,3-diacylglucosamine diphosphatase [Cocleimonas sp. KMM 6892]|uniref:UDP-2,3-diacylglucosamine diphosphatase n=1 Tax=unclassified Cocleimonas TaxID=2639732 RepID=UPI002DBF5EEB|nr:MULTISPECIES: UDP-2,3-diacylglucosamine diphosphatase [unclassified Cocleimonas]MEB8430600.1 UDP-2,3-diacylglucosamine diphosphatase [Cocleimonas sp. KMM 6892]MEC4716949.1 UDP-2,3-diacylglucosamine diphosphatase [Cocleimonas sp. KMM 6895]MEC4743961.1 UDP-2,3-diacylglucosamine diphosphatase [Cocleimonas sp. KMM 6896]